MNQRKKPTNACSYCGIEGHQQPTCHVEAEGRTPDACDVDAAALVYACTAKGRIDPLAMRAALAQTYRTHREILRERRAAFDAIIDELGRTKAALRETEAAFEASLLDEQ